MKHIKNENAIGPVTGVILMIAITIVLAAVIAAFVFGTSGNISRMQQTGCIEQQCGTFAPLPSLCYGIRTKTSVILVVDEFLNNYIVDADGVQYDWTYGGMEKFDRYTGHNVTFTYDQCNLVRGRYQILSVIQDHTYVPSCISCNACNCGCTYS